MGNQLLFDRDPLYPKDADRKYGQREHTVPAVAEAVGVLQPSAVQWLAHCPAGIDTALGIFVGYVLLDAWVANQDRHHQNWGAIQQPDGVRRLAIYTASGGHGETAIDQEEAVLALLKCDSICRAYFHRFDWSKWTTGTPAQKLSLLPAGQEHILAAAAKDPKPVEYRQRFLQTVTDLSKAFALAVPHEKALEIRDDVGFFQAVRAAMTKGGGERKKTDEERDAAIRQIISRAVASDAVVDIFAAAGLKKPDISILSEQFLAEVRGMPQKNLAVELLRKLLGGEIKLRSRKFLIQSKSFAEMLEQAIRKYQNRAIEAAAVIEELIKIAKAMRDADQRGEDSGLTEEERAFYDALADNESAVEAMGSKELRVIATELVTQVRKSVTIDWTVRESARAKIKVMVKRILRKHGYPPDLQEEAVKTVLAQAELLCAKWAA